MAGNVAEWTALSYRPYAAGRSYDPGYLAAMELGFLLVRGGSWKHFRFQVRTSERIVCTNSYSGFDVGFRCAADVADVVDAFIAATHYTGDEVAFNIGTGKATAVIDLLDVIDAAAGTSLEPTFAPARADEWRHGALDSTKAAAELNWTSRTSIMAGIQQTYRELTQTG